MIEELYFLAIKTIYLAVVAIATILLLAEQAGWWPPQPFDRNELDDINDPRASTTNYPLR
jgi:hypothetical protein